MDESGLEQFLDDVSPLPRDPEDIIKDVALETSPDESPQEDGQPIVSQMPASKDVSMYYTPDSTLENISEAAAAAADKQ